MGFSQTGIFQQYGALFIRMGRLLDAVTIFFSLYVVVEYLGFEWGERYVVVGLLGVIFFETIASFFDLYRSLRLVRIRVEILRILSYWSIALVLVTFISYVLSKEVSWVSPRIFLYWFFIAFFAMLVSRYIMRLVLRYYRAFGHDYRVACFAGKNQVAMNLQETFLVHPWMGVKVAGFFDVDTPSEMVDSSNVDVAGNLDDLVGLALSKKIDIVYITLPLSQTDKIQDIIDRLSDTLVSIYYCPDLFEFDLLNSRWDNVFGQPVVSIVESPFFGLLRLVKRLEDIVLCIFLIPLIFFPMLLIAVGIKLDSKGPIFFRQTRYGLDGKSFQIWKFRTMFQLGHDVEFQQATKNDDRITPLGTFLRRTSLDELPQLINVVLGSMSIVGPRPHPVKLDEEHRKLIRHYMLRSKIKPGITGLAQVSGFRGETETLSKMQGRITYDLEYMNNWSVWLDISILLKTLRVAFGDKNAY